MSVSNPVKTVSTAALDCGGRATVTLAFDAAPELNTAPADIVLIMDRSGSTGGAPLLAAKQAAGQLIATVAGASGSTDGLTIENGSRLGLVSFSDTATADLDLGTDVTALNSAVNALAANGFTNHRAAFDTAAALLAPSTSPRRIIILFTDGLTTVGGSADAAAEAIRQSGIEIYCIGLVQDDAPLRRWATDPDDIHVASTGSVSQLQKVFDQVAAEVVLAGALDVSVEEILAPGFKIIRVDAPSHGTAIVRAPDTILWTADAVGAAGPETASLTFEIQHTGTDSGTLPVNASVSYQDRQDHLLDFPDPRVEVTCPGTVVYPDPCPLPVTAIAESCQDTLVIDAKEAVLSGLGRIVQVDAVVKNVCPGRQLAVAVILTELDADGVEHGRGAKTLLVPPLDGDACRDVELKCVSFVVPESLSPSGEADSICGPRGFRTRVLANYVDTDFVCCDPRTVMV